MSQAEPGAAAARILVIDDEPQICKFLDIGLRAQGYRVDIADEGGAGLAALATRGADLVILDLGLPDRDGLDVLAELRQWSPVPVIVLTVRAGEAEKVRVLDAGANDYVTKPFGVQELMARIRALLRAHAAPAGTAPLFDDGVLRVDLARREVTLNAEPVALSPQDWGWHRVLNLPGLTVSMHDEIAALRAVAGEAVAARIEPRLDESVMRLVRTWAARFDTARARAMGFAADADFASIVRAYIEDNPQAVKRG